MQYFNPVVDASGYTHSIDMIYVEYLIKGSWKWILDILREFHATYPDLKYDEYLDRSPCSKYDFYLDAVYIGGVDVKLGKYSNYDAMNKKFDLIDMCQLRVNPNKHMHEDWFKEFLVRLLEYNGGACIRKYDYAIDLELVPEDVQIFNSRKEKGLYKGTRYFGQAGRHGYAKIYDKAKECKKKGIECPEALTRVEYTFMGNNIPSLEEVYVCVDERLDSCVELKDTEKAIVDMYKILQTLGVEYDLHLGRKMGAKLRPYLQGKYKKIEYGSHLDELLERMKEVFCAYLDELPDVLPLPADADGFISCEGVEDLPFE